MGPILLLSAGALQAHGTRKRGVPQESYTSTPPLYLPKPEERSTSHFGLLRVMLMEISHFALHIELHLINK